MDTENSEIKRLAQLMLDQLETRTRDNEQELTCFKNTHEQWMLDIAYEAHNGLLSDDFKFQFIKESLSAIVNSVDLYDDIYLDADIYTSELLKWISSSVYRLEYADTALSELNFDYKHNFIDILQAAQYLEKYEVLQSVLSGLRTRAKNED